MLDLTGRKADGWIAPLAAGYEAKPAAQDRIDRAARAAGRDPASIRRVIQLVGTVTGTPHTASRPRSGPGGQPIRTTPDIWAKIIAEFAAPDQHGPSLMRLEIKPVDLEGDVVVGVRDTGSEVLIGIGVLGGAENDRTFVQLVLNWQRHGPVPAAVDQSPEPLGAEQPKAFILVQALHHPPPGASGWAGRRGTAGEKDHPA